MELLFICFTFGWKGVYKLSPPFGWNLKLELMKIQEIRVGNWYNSVKFGCPVQCELFELHELYVRSNGAYGDPPIEEVFEPIPLTEEWLLKYGFEKDSIHDDYFKPCGEYEIKIVINAFSGSLTNDPSWFISIQTGYGNQPVTIYKKYVHQLQNLYFALTGEELINNG